MFTEYETNGIMGLSRSSLRTVWNKLVRVVFHTNFLLVIILIRGVSKDCNNFFKHDVSQTSFLENKVDHVAPGSNPEYL